MQGCRLVWKMDGGGGGGVLVCGDSSVLTGLDGNGRWGEGGVLVGWWMEMAVYRISDGSGWKW
jgi:hypothetical protein